MGDGNHSEVLVYFIKSSPSCSAVTHIIDSNNWLLFYGGSTSSLEEQILRLPQMVIFLHTKR